MTFSVVSTVAHAVGVGVFGYSLYYDLLYVHPPASLIAESPGIKAATKWPGKWKYLTVWNIVLQLVYHTLALVNDLVGSAELNKNRQTFLQKLRDAYFASWVFPTGMFVCVTFWALQVIDEGLIGMPDFVPDWLNHVLHTLPIFVILMESVLFPHSRQNPTVTCSTIIAGYFIYVAWIVWINHLTDVWPYPILSLLGPTERALFIGALGVVILMFYFLGEALNVWRWGSAGSSHAEKRKKKAK